MCLDHRPRPLVVFDAAIRSLGGLRLHHLRRAHLQDAILGELLQVDGRLRHFYNGSHGDAPLHDRGLARALQGGGAAPHIVEEGTLRGLEEEVGM